MRFTKLHGLGNDYVCVNCFEEPVSEPSKLARNICRRNFGVGSDGIILIKPSSVADFCMEMYNPDGSRGAMCGNGIRCLGKFVYDSGMTRGRQRITVETDAGIHRLYIHAVRGSTVEVTVDMGIPGICLNDGVITLKAALVRMRRQDIPADCRESGLLQTITVGSRDIKVINITAGNPHAVVFCDNLDSVDVRGIGSAIETYDAYPDRTNVEFVQVKDFNRIEVKVWERGAGETLACGTGACAACAAAIATGKVSNSVRVCLPGGELTVNFNMATGHLILRGSAVEVFTGEIRQSFI